MSYQESCRLHSEENASLCSHTTAGGTSSPPRGQHQPEFQGNKAQGKHLKGKVPSSGQAGASPRHLGLFMLPNPCPRAPGTALAASRHLPPAGRHVTCTKWRRSGGKMRGNTRRAGQGRRSPLSTAPLPCSVNDVLQEVMRKRLTHNI